MAWRRCSAVVLLSVVASCDNADGGGPIDFSVQVAGRDSRELNLSLAVCDPKSLKTDVDESVSEVRIALTAESWSSHECSTGVTILLDAPLSDRTVWNEHTSAQVIVVDGDS